MNYFNFVSLQRNAKTTQTDIKVQSQFWTVWADILIILARDSLETQNSSPCFLERAAILLTRAPIFIKQFIMIHRTVHVDLLFKKQFKIKINFRTNINNSFIVSPPIKKEFTIRSVGMLLFFTIKTCSYYQTYYSIEFYLFLLIYLI